MSHLRKEEKMNVGFVSLGCSKNLIDTEATIGKFKENNFNIVNDEKKADIIVVNTCGFIDSAKEEAINTILEMAEYKKGRCKYLIAMGCLVQRYYDDLIKLGYDWDIILQTRGWWAIKQYSTIIPPFLSSIDLLYMRLGKYIPYWMDENKKVKKEYSHLFTTDKS